MNSYTGLMIAGWLSLAVQAAGTHCVRMDSPVVTFYFGVETAFPDPNQMEVIDGFHTDLSTPYLCGEGLCRWDFAVSPNDLPGGGARRIPPQRALLFVNPLARMTMPASPAFAFLGASPGQTIWVLPQNYLSGVLWLGFNSGQMTADVLSGLCLWNPQDAGRADTPARWLRVRLLDVRRPQGSHFSLWQTGSFGQPRVFFSTYDGGITEQDVYYYQAGAHTHLNWGFTKPGLYEVDLQLSTFYQCSSDLTADLTGDCRVNLSDAAVIAAHWLQSGCADPNSCGGADLNQSGRVEPADLSILADQWLFCGSPFPSECL
ncbi:MAG: choice-of-anchor M domain-containing protein [Anaerohalosphaeraceae bacterium]